MKNCFCKTILCALNCRLFLHKGRELFYTFGQKLNINLKNLFIMNYEKGGNEIQITGDHFEFRIFLSDNELKRVVQDFSELNLEVKVLADLYPTSPDFGQPANEIVEFVQDALRKKRE